MRILITLLRSGRTEYLTRQCARAHPCVAMSPSDAAERQRFVDAFPQFAEECLDNICIKEPELRRHFEKALYYNVPHGSLTRGLTVLKAFRALAKPDAVTPDNIKIATMLGWCVQLMEGAIAISDDMCDDALTRHGKPCWYKVEEIQYTAVNDIWFVNYSLYYLLQKHIRDKPYYLDMYELFTEASLHTTTGDLYDIVLSRIAKTDVTQFTLPRWKTIAEHRTGAYIYTLPVMAAMLMAGVTDPAVQQKARKILREIGTLQQAKEDYLDSFGDTPVKRKIGSDVEEGRCGWLISTALSKASKEQKELLQRCYGSSDPQSVTAARKLFADLGLPALFKAYEDESVQRIRKLVSEAAGVLPAQLFQDLLDDVHRRQK